MLDYYYVAECPLDKTPRYIAVDNKEVIYVVLDDNKLYEISPLQYNSDKTPRLVPQQPEDVGPLAWDGKNNILYVCANKRIFRYSPQSKTFENTVYYSLLKLTAITVDKNGDVYFSEFGEHFSKVKKIHQKIEGSSESL